MVVVVNPVLDPSGMEVIGSIHVFDLAKVLHQMPFSDTTLCIYPDLGSEQ